MSRPICPVCKHYKLVMPDGPEDAEVLILGEFPGVEEVLKGIPWCGPASRVLNSELAKAGIIRSECRVSNLWLHQRPKPPGKEPKSKTAHENWEARKAIWDPEFAWHLEQMQLEMHGRRAILVMGSELAPTLFGRTISAVAGCYVKSDMFPASVTVSVAMKNPAIVFRPGPEGKLGETRLAIQRFADALN